MPASLGLIKGLNGIRQTASSLYQDSIGIITDQSDISTLATPVLNIPEVYNEFISSLIHRIAYTKFNKKMFNNPLAVLEGDTIPLGYVGQEIHVNAQGGRRYNSDDFAGLLKKYEADVKVQYMPINMDIQYPVTISRNQLRKAFVSWTDLEELVSEVTNALYNGSYIDQFRYTKYIVSEAYNGNKGIIEVLDAPDTKELATKFVEKLRTYYLDFQLPSSNYNAWKKCGGEGKPVLTFADPEDIVILLRNDLRSFIDVNVLASSFNIEKSTLLGNMLPVDNFDAYNDDGEKVFDGSNIVGLICDKSWFRIKKQDEFMDNFYNANNRTINWYLNIIKMYNFSMFANGVILATALPEPKEEVEEGAQG